MQTRPQMTKSFITRVQRMRPGLLVILSFLGAAAVGALLLALPAASIEEPLSPLDALFTATSAVCVTGLVVVDTGTHFTAFGKGVILALIQLGGLGIMTFSVFLYLFVGRSIGTRERFIISETFSATPIRELRKLLGTIFAFTFSVEAAGAVALFFVWRGALPTSEAVFTSVFHSVSAFCNAGFSLFDTSFVAYRGDVLLNAAVMALIVLGGIGVPVMYELRLRLHALRRGRRVLLSLHTKLVLVTSAVLILAGALLTFLLERRGALAGLPPGERIMAALFQSVTSRTAGFNTLDIGALEPATLLIIIMLMFIGASPGSTGGGIKTTSLAVFAAILSNRFAGRESVCVFKRTVPPEMVTRAMSILVLAALTVTAGLVLLLVIHMGTNDTGEGYFLSYLFETVSAFGTVGLSMGLTPTLSAAGKMIIIVLMFIGRVGLLTVAYVVTRQVRRRFYSYAEENVMIG